MYTIDMYCNKKNWRNVIKNVYTQTTLKCIGRYYNLIFKSSYFLPESSPVH